MTAKQHRSGSRQQTYRDSVAAPAYGAPTPPLGPFSVWSAGLFSRSVRLPKFHLLLRALLQRRHCQVFQQPRQCFGLRLHAGGLLVAGGSIPLRGARAFIKPPERTKIIEEQPNSRPASRSASPCRSTRGPLPVKAEGRLRRDHQRTA